MFIGRDGVIARVHNPPVCILKPDALDKYVCERLNSGSSAHGVGVKAVGIQGLQSESESNFSAVFWVDHQGETIRLISTHTHQIFHPSHLP